MEIIKWFLASGRPGIYFRVVEEGEVQTGDKIEITRRDKNNVTVKDIVRLYFNKGYTGSIESMRRAMRISALPDGWKHGLRQNIEQLESKP